MKPHLGRILLATCALLSAGSAAAQLQVKPTSPRQDAGQVYVEDSPAAQERAAEALDLLAQGRHAEAAQKLQEVIESYPHKLMPTGESSYTDAVLWVLGTVREDARLLEAYRALYEPEAERELSLAMPDRDRGIDAEGLRRVISRYALTRAGLDAGLALAAYYLERAEGADALGVLAEVVNHPDMPAEVGRYHLMRGVASMLIGDTSGHEAERLALLELPDPAFLSELEALSNRIHPPLRLHPTAGSNPDASGLPKQLDTPLWGVDLVEALWQGLGQRVDVRTLPPEQAVLRVLPANDSDKVYINLGVKAIAYDRASGWQLWEVPDPTKATPNAAVMMSNTHMLTEPRGLYLSGGRAYTLLGWTHPNQNANPEWKNAVVLVSLDAGTGREVWRVTPGELDATLGNTSFDGTPNGADGRIYTFVKRVRVSGLQDLYLTAVRQSDGELIWRRHLSSTSSRSNYNIGPSARMALHAGRVYVSDNRGTVIALDGATGTVRWLTVLPGAGAVDPSAGRRHNTIKDVPEPVLVEAGLLVPSFVEGDAYRLLDPVGGAMLKELDDRTWRDIDACYPAGGDVLAVGEKGVSLIDGGTLDILWRKSLDVSSEGRVRGRPAIAAQMNEALRDRSNTQAPSGVVVFSTDHRLIAVALEDGSVLTDAPIVSPGNVMLNAGQVVVASTADLHAYTDWHVAHDQLKKQAGLDLSNPRPGMAMAGLALRTGRDAAVLEGIDLALAALGSDPDMTQIKVDDTRQRDVFGMLREFVDPAGGAQQALRGQLLNRMAAATVYPDQEAAYQLICGMYLQERGEPVRAVEHYQAVMSDPTLAAELFAVDRGSRRAGLEARRLLKALIGEHGREVYRSYDLLAEHELAELVARNAQDAQAFAELADRYPLALCVNEARQYAADHYLQAGDHVSALWQLQAVYLVSESDEVLSQITGRIAGVYLEHDRPELASRWLRRVEREHPGLILLRDDQPMHTESWLSELRQLLSASQRLPGFELPLASPVWIEGWPMPINQVAPGIPQLSDRVLMTDGASIWMLTAPSMTELWRIPLPALDAHVLAVDDRQVIWRSTEREQIGAIDNRTGEALWPPVDVKTVLEETGDPRVVPQHKTRQQQEHIQILGGVRNPRLNMLLKQSETPKVVIDPTAILVADRIGRVVCIDRNAGRIRWRTIGPADSLTAMATADGLVALGGASWADTAAQHGVITLLDTLTGEPLATEIQSDKVPDWLGFAENGLLIVAMPVSLTGYETTTGRTEWRTELQQPAGTTQHRLSGRLLLVSGQRRQVGAAQVIDTDNGRIVNQLPIRSTTDQPMVFDAAEADGQWFTLTQMQALALGAAGQTRWTDAICAPIGNLLLQRIGSRHVCVVGGISPAPTPDPNLLNLGDRPNLEQVLINRIQAVRQRSEAQGYRLYMLDRASGSIISDTPLDGIEAEIDPDSSVLVDGALLLRVGDRTRMIQGQSSAD